MANNYFTFKQFTIEQGDCAMKVGTDGVLLGAWASAPNVVNSILDIGSGTGLISLMLAQRFAQSQVVAVEIEVAAARQAQHNIEASPWVDRVQLFHVDFLRWETNNRFDLIVSNPPFFENSLKNTSASKTMARHTDSLPFAMLLQKSKDLLTPIGVVCLVIPVQAYQAIVDCAQTASLCLHAALWIKTTPTKDAKRVLLRFGLEAKECDTKELIIESNGRHGYSDEYKWLTHDFYLEK